MILEHLVEELASFLNNKHQTQESGPAVDADGEPKVRELHDEPDFAWVDVESGQCCKATETDNRLSWLTKRFELSINVCM